MRYHICTLQPAGYPHTAAFDELIELLAYSLQDLGHTVTRGTNRLPEDWINIVFGMHLVDATALELPANSILFNTEQVADDASAWVSRVVELARSYEVWDYSEKNIAKLQSQGAKRVRLFQIGFHPRLARIPHDVPRDIDVLFYGSFNPRRQAVLDQLRQAGCGVKAVFGVYGAERDALIARSKLVLNLHFYQSKIFEVVRVFYLMTNARAVVAECGPDTTIDPNYLPGICAAEYADLAAACLRLLADNAARQRLQARALEAMMQLPQYRYTPALCQPAPVTKELASF